MIKSDQIELDVAEFKSLLDKVSTYLPEDKAELVSEAYHYADQCHSGQMRMSGEPYIAHPKA